jgi:shikimate kinase
MESDNLEVVETTKNSVVSHGIGVAIFDDLRREFLKNQFVHVFWKANTVARELARLAMNRITSMFMD